MLFVRQLVLTTCLLIMACTAQKPAVQKPEKPEDAKQMDTQMANCKMSGKSLAECRAQLGNSTSMTRPKDAEEAANLDRFDAQKGAAAALAERLSNCTGTKAQCRDQAKEALSKLMGQNLTEEELAYDLQRAGASKAQEVIKACQANASTTEEKKACLRSDAAKAEAAKVSGRDAGKIKNEDLAKAAREGAASDMATIMKSCMESAENATAKKACLKRDDLKSTMAASMGRNKSDVKDSEVRESLRQAAQNDALMMLQNCNKSEMAKCKEQAKTLQAKASGKNASEITDSKLQLDASKAMSRNLADKMVACVEDAGENASARALCKERLAASSVQSADLTQSGRKLSQTDLEVALQQAALSKAREISEDCTGSRQECKDILTERVAMSMGKRKEDLTEKDVETIMEEGAREAGKSAAKACREAREEDANATCEDPVEKYMQSRKIEKSGDTKKDDVQKKNIKQNMAKDLEKDAMRVCLEEASKAEADKCLNELKTETADVSAELFKDLPAEAQQAKQKRAKLDASREVVGERFHLCMKAAQTQEEKDACLADMKNKTSIAGLSEKAEDIALRYRGQEVAEAARACNMTQRAACIQQVKDELKQAGMKEREFGKVTKLAAIKSAAETWVACKENTTNSDEVCDNIVKASLEDESGEAGIWTDDMKAKVQKLGEALMNGTETVLRKLKRVGSDAVTDGTACSDSVFAKITGQLENVSRDFNLTDARGAMNISSRRCRLVFGKAQYESKLPTNDLNETEIALLSDTVASNLAGLSLSSRRLLVGRRLDQVTSVYADQEVQECAASDSTCGADTNSLQSPSPSPMPSSSPTPLPSPSPSSSSTSSPSPSASAGADSAETSWSFTSALFVISASALSA
eukprot:TRINITY_DN81_c0_g1_i7.p1 TRINITY_DN81_c0_g1~~TRINITY_DN81_c0_g1_i7.p1  ORF type:complete len:907 (+),score=260.12 TRINITY_DN81_c0_g1_i7:103-2721(+)